MICDTQVNVDSQFLFTDEITTTLRRRRRWRRWLTLSVSSSYIVSIVLHSISIIISPSILYTPKNSFQTSTPYDMSHPRDRFSYKWKSMSRIPQENVRADSVVSFFFLLPPSTHTHVSNCIQEPVRFIPSSLQLSQHFSQRIPTTDSLSLSLVSMPASV